MNYFEGMGETLLISATAYFIYLFLCCFTIRFGNANKSQTSDDMTFEVVHTNNH